jgi:hypothetical protein
MRHTTPVAKPAPVVPAPAGLIPLSQLSLDVDEPSVGWAVYLADHNIPVDFDDIGRPAVSRADARQLLDEQHENEARVREVARRQEQQAIEADQRFRAALPVGVSWYEIPDGVLPVVAMTQAARDAQPKRTTPLEEALSGESMIFHPLPQVDES